jgi:hypothetical protein
MRKLQTTLAKVRVHGVVGAWNLLRWNVFSLVTCVRMRVDLVSWQVPDRPMPAALRIELGRIEDLQRFRASVGTATLPDAFLVDQTYGLSHFYLGIWGGEIACIQWIARSGDSCSVSSLRLRPDESEFRNAYTLERFRRRDIFGHVLRVALRDQQQGGMAACFTHVDEGNLASLRGLKNAGFLPIEKVVIRRILGWDRVYVEPISEDRVDP